MNPIKTNQDWWWLACRYDVKKVFEDSKFNEELTYIQNTVEVDSS